MRAGILQNGVHRDGAGLWHIALKRGEAVCTKTVRPARPRPEVTYVNWSASGIGAASPPCGGRSRDGVVSRAPWPGPVSSDGASPPSGKPSRMRAAAART